MQAEGAQSPHLLYAWLSGRHSDVALLGALRQRQPAVLWHRSRRALQHVQRATYMADCGSRGRVRLPGVERSDELTMLSGYRSPASGQKQRTLRRDHDAIPQIVQDHGTSRILGEAVDSLMKRSITHNGSSMIASLRRCLSFRGEPSELSEPGRGNLTGPDPLCSKLGMEPF